MMFELPLFPLKTVLFPGVPLNLHVFEPRYKTMIAHCEANDQPFGVVLIKQGREAHGALPEPHQIGCTARIIKVNPLEDGRLNIATMGVERFRILELDWESQPYLIGQVELFPMRGVGREMPKKATRLRKNLIAYLNALAKYGKIRIETDFLPTQTNVLAYLGAFLLQAPVGDKQALLALPSLSMFITQINKLFLRELALLPIVMAPPDDENRYFSLN